MTLLPRKNGHESDRLFLVAATGIEPVTLGLWVLRSNQLSYAASSARTIGFLHPNKFECYHPPLCFLSILQTAEAWFTKLENERVRFAVGRC